jgi:beta-lactam-binding protein with PASTA domain
VLVLAMALSATFGAFFLTGMRVANRAREVQVPDLRGRSLTEANQALADVGLVMRVEMRRPDAKIPPNHVLDQEPEPGAVIRRQRSIRVRVSEGQRDPVVPALTGQAERTAAMVLAQEKLELADRVVIRTTSYASGTVVAQDPAPEQRAPRVSLLVNEGEQGVGYVMPDVIGTSAGRVVEILRRRGFRVTVAAEVPYPGLPSGIVIRQTPQGGFQVGYGDPVVLEVSR